MAKSSGATIRTIQAKVLYLAPIRCFGTPISNGGAILQILRSGNAASIGCCSLQMQLSQTNQLQLHRLLGVSKCKLSFAVSAKPIRKRPSFGLPTACSGAGYPLIGMATVLDRLATS